jgi:hypothetical protein
MPGIAYGQYTKDSTLRCRPTEPGRQPTRFQSRLSPMPRRSLDAADRFNDRLAWSMSDLPAREQRFAAVDDTADDMMPVGEADLHIFTGT